MGSHSSKLSNVFASLSIAISIFMASPTSAATLDSEAGENFFGDDLGWTLDLSLLPRATTGDPEALAEVARLFQEGDEQAALAFRNYLKRHPSDPAAFDLGGVILIQEGDLESAIVSFQKGIILDPASTWLKAKLGAAYAMSDQDGKAQVQFEKALRLDPDNPLALRHMAQYAVQYDRLDLATQYSERALRAFGMPKNTVNQAHFDLAELYLQLNRSRSGLELLRGAVNNDDLQIPEERKLELYGRYLDFAMNANAPSEARLAYEKLGPLVNPDDPRVRLTDARILRMEGDFEGAIALLDEIANAHSDFAPQLLPDKAIALVSFGKDAEAADIWRQLADQADDDTYLSFLREALTADLRRDKKDEVAEEVQALALAHPDRTDIALFELEFLGKTGQTELALERAIAASQAFPESASIFEMLGVVASAVGDKEAGRAALERSLEIDSSQVDVWLTLTGVIHGHGSYTGHGENGSHADVVSLLERALEANPTSSELYAELGLVHLSDGRIEEAITNFDSAVTNNPTHMAGLSLGALARADANEDLGSALALIDRARIMAPDDPINKDIMGWVIVRQGDAERGLELLTEAAAEEPQDVTIQYHIGVAKQMLGDNEAATMHYLAALAGPNYDHNTQDTRERYLALSNRNSVQVEMSRIDVGNEGVPIGTIEVASTPDGVSFVASMTEMEEGPYAAHVHEYANCNPGADGPGSLAGAHFGHADHAGHDMSAMAGNMPKPKGDLPSFIFDVSGNSATEFVHPPLMLEEIRGRTIILHLGNDIDGKSGPKMACGIIP